MYVTCTCICTCAYSVSYKTMYENKYCFVVTATAALSDVAMATMFFCNSHL